jgi:bifunctional non-homologous end joining protein LigD
MPSVRTAPFPGFIRPALATLETSAPGSSGWVHELKFDGYRLQVRIRAGKVALLTRRGLDWTDRFGEELRTALLGLPVQSAILDGEVVVLTANGLPSFAALKEAISEGDGRFVFYAFDLLYLDGRDLRDLPLLKRKAALAKIITPGRVQYSEHFEDGQALFTTACSMGAEGIVSKRGDAPYRSGRGKAWLKVKCSSRQELVIAGYVLSTVSITAIGSLVLGYYQDGKLVYAGRVGTGWSHKTAEHLYRQLEAIRAPASPFAKCLARADARGVRFVRPDLVAEVQFRGWTGDQLLRHASFLGLREDKNPHDVALEQAH